MTVGEKEADELEKLLVEVRRTIRENDQFIRHLKEESFDPEGPEEDSENNITADDGGYEEL